MKKFPRPFCVNLLLFLLSPLVALCQSNTNPETLWTSGKIFVVLIVAGIIFSGIGIFLVALERKITRLEKKITDKKQ